MNCVEARFLLDGYSDGELDLVNHLNVEMHMDECSECSQRNQNNVSIKQAILRESLYYRAPVELRQRVLRSIELPENRNLQEPWWRRKMWLTWAATGAVCVLTIAIIATLWPGRTNNEILAQEFTQSHIRSLMADHLTDVDSTDQHTVKPWFDGRLDFAPPVIDLGPQGFTLIGGRLDYAANRPVAAIVYKRRQHLINLFVFPDQSQLTEIDDPTVKQGYNLVHWKRSGMAFWAVSDLNIAELKEFSQLYQN